MILEDGREVFWFLGVWDGDQISTGQSVEIESTETGDRYTLELTRMNDGPAQLLAPPDSPLPAGLRVCLLTETVRARAEGQPALIQQASEEVPSG